MASTCDPIWFAREVCELVGTGWTAIQGFWKVLEPSQSQHFAACTASWLQTCFWHSVDQSMSMNTGLESGGLINVTLPCQCIENIGIVHGNQHLKKSLIDHYLRQLKGKGKGSKLGSECGFKAHIQNQAPHLQFVCCQIFLDQLFFISSKAGILELGDIESFMTCSLGTNHLSE